MGVFSNWNPSSTIANILASVDNLLLNPDSSYVYYEMVAEFLACKHIYNEKVLGNVERYANDPIDDLMTFIFGVDAKKRDSIKYIA